MVTLFLSGLVSLLFLSAFHQVTIATGSGDKNVEIRGVHRKTQEQIAFYIRQMVVPDLKLPALISPTVGNTQSTLVYNAPDNHLDDAIIFDPRNPNFAEFTLRLDTSGSMYLQRTDLTGPLQSLGRSFITAEFERDQKATVLVRLTSETAVRGAQNNTRNVQEITENYVFLPGAD